MLTNDKYFDYFSIVAISAYIRNCRIQRLESINKVTKHESDVNVIIDTETSKLEAGKPYDDGVTILEALSATGLRSIRYAKEIPGVKRVIANDLSHKAVEDIKTNVQNNAVEDMITVSHDDAV